MPKAACKLCLLVFAFALVIRAGFPQPSPASPPCKVNYIACNAGYNCCCGQVAICADSQIECLQLCDW